MNMYRGVSYDKAKRRYRAEVYGGGRRVYRATFTTALEAALAHDRAAKQNFGDEAVLNHLPDGSLNPLRFTRHSTEKTNMYQEGRYRAEVYDGGRRVYRASFSTALEAALAYDRAAKQNFGDEAVLNHLPDGSLNPLRFTTRHTIESSNMYRGVSYEKARRRYRAEVCDGGRRVYRATFSTALEAALAHDRTAKQSFGDKAVLNYLPDGSLNPLRFTTRHTIESSNMYRGVSYEQAKPRQSSRKIKDTHERGQGKAHGEAMETEDASKRRRLNDHAITSATDEPRGNAGGQPCLVGSVVEQRGSEAPNMDLGTVLSILKPEALKKGEEFQAVWRELEKLSESVLAATMSVDEPKGPAEQSLYSFLVDTVCEAYTQRQLQKEDLKEMVLVTAKWTVNQAAGKQGMRR